MEVARQDGALRAAPNPAVRSRDDRVHQDDVGRGSRGTKGLQALGKPRVLAGSVGEKEPSDRFGEHVSDDGLGPP